MAGVAKTTYRTSVVSENAFKNIGDEKKSKADLSYERNTYRKMTHEMRQERDALAVSYDTLKREHEGALKLMVQSGVLGAEERMWAWVEKHPRSISVHTSKTTGEKTKIETRPFKARGEKEEKPTLVHTIPAANGEYKFYKRAVKGDEEPTYYMKETKVSKENFTLGKNGEFEPIKKY